MADFLCVHPAFMYTCVIKNLKEKSACSLHSGWHCCVRAVSLVGALSVALCRFGFRFVQFLYSWISMLPMINKSCLVWVIILQEESWEKLDNQLEKMNFTFTERVCGRWGGVVCFLRRLFLFFVNLFWIQQELLSLVSSLQQVCETQVVFISVKCVLQVWMKLSTVLPSVGFMLERTLWCRTKY